MSIRTPINEGILQSDLDVAGFELLNFAGGSGLPAGGTTGQLLQKQSNTDGDADWATVASGGGGMPGTFINVKDAPYNAAGDGVTDDTVAINTAIAAVCTAGGGTVFFPHGIYLCNGAFHTYWHSILVIPFTDYTQVPVTLRLLGEEMPAWSAPGTPPNFLNISTIKTTRTDGMTADVNGFAAVIAGNVPFGNPLHSTYSDMSSVMVRIKNMQFLVPDDPTMGGIRLDGIGNAFVEDVVVNAGDASVAPTHGTTAVWMPNAINWSINWMLHVSVTGFDTGFKTGEHLRAPMIQAYYCKVGVSFLESMYPSWANIQLGACVDGIKFLGAHIVDLLLETEHGGGWTAPANDISDPSNYGNGIVRYFIGHGTPSNPDVNLSMDGGTGLTTIGLFSGKITLNTSQGIAGAGAGSLTGTIYPISPLYIGGDARLTAISGGVKLEARNTGTGIWVEAARWTNP